MLNRFAVVMTGLLTMSCGSSHVEDDADGSFIAPDECSVWYRRGCPFANADIALSSGWLLWRVVDWSDEERSPVHPKVHIDSGGTFHLAFADESDDSVFYATGTPATGFVHERVASGGVQDVEPGLALCDGEPRMAFSLADGRAVLATRADSGWVLADLPFDAEGGPAQPAIACRGDELWAVGRDGASFRGLAIVRPDGSRGDLPAPFSFGDLPATRLEMQPTSDGIGVLMNRLEGPVVALAREGRTWDWGEPDVRNAALLRGDGFAAYEIVQVSTEPVAHALQVRVAVDGEAEPLPLPNRRLQGLDAVRSEEGVTHLGLDAVYEVHHASGRGDEWTAAMVDDPGPGAGPAIGLEGERPWIVYRKRHRLVIATHPRDW